MRNFKDEVWPNEFNFEESAEKQVSSGDYKEILEESYGALNKLYQKETRRSKTPKRMKQAWQ